MNLHDFVKKYIWDEDKTPYFKSVARLTRKQADNEIMIYAAFLGVVFVMMELISASAWNQTGEFQFSAIAFYCAVIVGGAIWLWRRKDVRAGWLCLTAPIAAALNFIFDGLHAELHDIDKYALLVFCLLWLRYSVRVINICRRYDTMPQPTRLD